MTTIGKTSWKIMISTSIIVSDGYNNYPSGDIMYVLAPKAEFSWDLRYQIETLYGGQSYSIQTGERLQMVGVKNAILLTNDINECTEIFINKAHSASAQPLYIFVKLPSPGSSEGGATQQATDYKSFENDMNEIVWHLRGYLKKPKVEADGPKQYRISFTFVECWI